MTAKEKAKKLLWEYLPLINGWENKEKTTLAKKLALIGVDELVDCLPSINGRPPNYQDRNKYTSEYWKEVKNELSLL
tara:strand:- start:473 stop:703 length:231 start_codon:yes stop_codon:yes gene_type:complete